MSEAVKVAFVSCSEELIPPLLDKFAGFFPEAPLCVVSEFPPPTGRWIPYHVRRSFWENLSLVRASLRGKRIALAAVVLEPRVPYRRLRLLGTLLAPFSTLYYNENLDHFTLRPHSLPSVARHFLWRLKNLLRWQLHPGGHLYTFGWRLAHPRAFRRPLFHLAALCAGSLATLAKAALPPREDPAGGQALPEGISVVVPSRNGRQLLARLLPGLLRQLRDFRAEVIVVDNGSDDGTGAFLKEQYPEVLVASSEEPLSFARAANRGIGRARFSHVCLLNNDMTLEEGFFAPLTSAFQSTPELFCATAQILFPPGQRRQETGKAVIPSRPAAGGGTDFPIRCELPVPGEDSSPVLYGSGGCSLYDTVKLRRLGGLDQVYEPAYVEDLDIGYRAWLRGWPTVFVAGARVVHEHRATTSRFFSERELERFLELNYLRFLARAVASPAVFRRLWGDAVRRLNRLASAEPPNQAALCALASAWRAPLWTRRPPKRREADASVLALGSGEVAVFSRQPAGHRPLVLVASPYLPFPLSHGGAVRMYNLMRRAAKHYDQVLVAFADELARPPVELLDICAEIVLMRRLGSHARPTTARPDVVEEFDSPAFRAALRQAVRKWRPPVAQLEFTQMAQYAQDCAPAKTVLVEHDITFDLYQQLLAQNDDWELRRQLKRWTEFETEAWRKVDCVVTMSERDRRQVQAARVECLANGVDLDRFTASAKPPEPGRVLFIGSFAHLPNVLAVEFFLREVWPLLAARAPKLHIIAGARHRYYLDLYRDRAELSLKGPGIEVEDFVADVRPAYERAEIVIAPLVASAGTNIKIMEAMAMGKAIVSTPAGINGLDLAWGEDVLVAETGAEMASAIAGLLEDAARRQALERQARATVERRFNWDTIAAQQHELYESLRG